MNLPIQKALEGKYEILEKIGEGGIGSVYKVRHRLLEEIRVIKVLRPQAADKEDLQERFLHEARMAIRLKHPNIAQLHDFSVTPDGTAYIVMEFIDGVGLDALLRACGPPSVELTMEIAHQGLTALAYLHAHQFVHRDVSPDNLMLTRSFDGSPLVKLIDLGIAKNLEGEIQLTATGVFVGKVRYSSPEQFSAGGGSEDLDQRSDLYSFGVMLYELLTGQIPIRGESFSEVAGGHLFHPPRPFDETDPGDRVVSGLREVVLKTLEKEPDGRYDSADALLAALQPFAGGESKLDQEAARLLEKTREALPQIGASKKPGSTQDRLDAEFGLVTTPSPTSLEEMANDATAVAPPAGEAKPAASRGGRRSVWLGLSVGGGALLAAGLTIWALLSRGEPNSEAVATSAAQRLTVEASTRWTPEIGDIDDSIFSNRPFPEPPPLGGESPQGTAPTPTGQAARTPPATTPPPEPAPNSGKAASTGGAGSQQEEASTQEKPELRRTSEVYVEGEVGVIPPVLLALPPTGPRLDKDLKKDILVIVTVLVDEFGEPLNPSIKKAPIFRKKLRETAMELAMDARFRPALKNGVAGRMFTDVQVVFPASE